MKFQIGDKVVYIGVSIFESKSGKKYAWKIEKNKIYTVKNIASDGKELFISVGDNNSLQSWYSEIDFISLQEARKLKLKKLN